MNKSFLNVTPSLKINFPLSTPDWLRANMSLNVIPLIHRHSKLETDHAEHDWRRNV